MNYDDHTLKQLHKVELDILSVVVELCKKNGITYFTLGGTTLGAVRESAIIAWDDDIDIGMLREDYERFIEIAGRELPEGYFLQHFTTEPDCGTYFAKVRKDGTRFVEEYMKNLPVHQGVYIDIKPLDFVPDESDALCKYRNKVKFREQLFLSKRLWRVGRYHSSIMNYAMRSVIRFLLHIILFPVKRETLFKSLESAITSYNASETHRVSFRGEQKTFGDVEDFLPVVPHPFENMMINIPHRAENVLVQQFGSDYLISKKRSEGHRPEEISFSC